MNFITSINNTVKSYDLFGYKLEFNYDKKGTNYKTIGGGIVSILIQMFVLSVMSLRLY